MTGNCNHALAPDLPIDIILVVDAGFLKNRVQENDVISLVRRRKCAKSKNFILYLKVSPSTYLFRLELQGVGFILT